MLRTKLHRPNVGPDLVVRDHLIQQLDQNRHKPLTLISAPSGYGKSVLVSQWIERNKVNAAWVSLDNEHQDLRVFLEYFVSALQTIIENDFQKVMGIINAEKLPSIKIIYEALIDELDHVEDHFVLVLDDYQVIHGNDIHDLVNLFIAYPVEKLQLVIICRRDPPLKINHLRLFDRINEIRLADLAFSLDDTKALVSKNITHDFTEDEFNKIYKRTEGWVLGMQMILMTDELKKINANLQPTAHYSLAEYSEFFAEFALRRYSDEFRNILYLSSLLDRLNHELLDVIIEKTDSIKKISGEQFIQNLIANNLFIYALDKEGIWYRFHHLFQDLLKLQLSKKIDEQRICSYYQTVSDWFIDHSFIDDGIQYAVKAKNYERAALIIESHRHQKVNDLQLRIIRRWMKLLPEGWINRRPSLLSAELFNCQETFQFAKIPALLDLLKKNLEINPDPHLEGELYFHKTYYDVFIQCNAKSAQKNISNAQKLIQGTGINARRLALYQAIILHMEGSTDKAIDFLRLQMEKNPNSVFSVLDYAVIFVMLLSGKIKEAASIGETFCFYMKGKNDLYIEAWGNYLYGLALFQMFNLGKSAIVFKDALDIDSIFHFRLALDAKVGSVLSKFLSNEIIQGKILFNELEEFAEELGLINVANSCKARVNLLLGNICDAKNWAKNYKEDFQVGNLFFLIEVPLITKARICIALNDIEEIKLCLADLSKYNDQASSINNQYQLIDILVLQSLGSYKIDKQDDAEVFLEQALEIGISTSFIHPFIEPGIQLKEMLGNLNIKNKHNEFINEIIELIDLTFPIGKLNRNEIKRQSLIARDFKLSSREKEIIKQVSNGYRNQEIAEKLHISLETVKSHIKNSLKKMNANNRVELVNKARFYEIIEPEA